MSLRRLRRSVTILAGLSLLCVACGSAGVLPPPRGGEDVGIDVTVGELQLRSLLLLMADQQRFEPLTVESALDGSPSLRRELALTLGRVGSRRGVSYLNQLLADAAPTVRRAAAFALGELELERADAETAARSLLVAAADADRDTGRLAVEALGKLGVSVTEVATALTASEMAEQERWARLLPPLFRFDEDAAVALALGGRRLAESDVVRRWAAYALTRQPRPVALPEIRRLAADAEPRVRAWAARALGIVGSAEDLSLLLPMLDDAEPAPRVQALRAGALLRQTADGDADPPPERWLPAHGRLLDDPAPHVRLEALDRVAPWLAGMPGDGETAAAAGLRVRVLERMEDEGAPVAERAAALVALAAEPSPPVADGVRRFAAEAAPRLRAAAARAAGVLSASAADALLDRLLGDTAEMVRTAAAEARLQHLEEMTAAPSAAQEETVRELAGAADPGVQAVVFAWLADHPVLTYVELTRAVRVALAAGNVETLLNAVDALRARAEEVPEERGSVVAVLERLAERGSWRVGRKAARALVALGRPAPPTGHPNLRRTPDLYEEIVQRTARPRQVRVETDAGALTLRVDCPTAPLTCLNFLQLVGQGFYDGLTFHRVVPDFVVQGGDPRGDGHGGPGYAIRDEPTPTAYERGVLGMARSGPHTAGSQFFLTLSPQPHLDGAYTAFGRVVEGGAVLDRITRGTRILSMVEVPLQ